MARRVHATRTTRRPQTPEPDAGPSTSATDTKVAPDLPNRTALPGLATDVRRAGISGDDPLGGAAIPDQVAGALKRRSGQGRPLPEGTASSMGAAFGADLSGVRVHDDAEASDISRSVQAEAFTHGTDIYFSQGKFAPDSGGGQRLLAHELSHVVQGQSGAAGGVVGRADDPAEHAADAMADRVMGSLTRPGAADRPTVGATQSAVRRFASNDQPTVRRLKGKAVLGAVKDKVKGAVGSKKKKKKGEQVADWLPGFAVGVNPTGPVVGSRAKKGSATGRTSGSADMAGSSSEHDSGPEGDDAGEESRQQSSAPVGRGSVKRPSLPAPDKNSSVSASSGSKSGSKSSGSKSSGSKSSGSGSSGSRSSGSRSSRSQGSRSGGGAASGAGTHYLLAGEQIDLGDSSSDSSSQESSSQDGSADQGGGPTQYLMAGQQFGFGDSGSDSSSEESSSQESSSQESSSQEGSADQVGGPTQYLMAGQQFGLDDSGSDSSSEESSSEESSSQEESSQESGAEQQGVPTNYLMSGQQFDIGDNGSDSSSEESSSEESSSQESSSQEDASGTGSSGESGGGAGHYQMGTVSTIFGDEAGASSEDSSSEESSSAESSEEELPDVLPPTRPTGPSPTGPVAGGMKPAPEGGKPKEHRAWATKPVDDHYKDEQTLQRPDLIERVRIDAKAIGVMFNALARLAAADPDDDQAQLAAIGSSFSAAFDKAAVGKTKEQRLRMIADLHWTAYEKAKLQALPVDERGNIDQAALSKRLVKYDKTEEQQQASSISISGGKLIRNNKAKDPVDTSEGSTYFSGKGAEIFVVSKTGQIHIASHQIGLFHHSSLLAAADVAMAGEIRAVGGQIQWISNKSGHYRPGKENFVQLLHWLKKDGVPLTFQCLVGMPAGVAMDPEHMLAGLDDAGQDNRKQGYQLLKTGALWQEMVKTFGIRPMKRVLDGLGWDFDNAGVLSKGYKEIPGKEARQVLKEKRTELLKAKANPDGPQGELESISEEESSEGWDSSSEEERHTTEEALRIWNQNRGRDFDDDWTGNFIDHQGQRFTFDPNDDERVDL